MLKRSSTESAAAAGAAAASASAAVSLDDAAQASKKQRTDDAAAVSTDGLHGLHKDALHSLFAFIDLPGMARLIQLSRAWRAGVCAVQWASSQTFASRGGDIQVICRSPLVRKLRHFKLREQLTASDLAMLTNAAPHLLSLSITLAVTSAVQHWRFPAEITELDVHVSDDIDMLLVAPVEAVLAGIGACTALRELDLLTGDLGTPAGGVSTVSLEPLAPLAPFLTRFWLFGASTSVGHIDFLRRCTSLRQLDYTDMKAVELAVLAAEPVTLTQLQELSLPIQLRVGPSIESLQRFPTLTTISLGSLRMEPLSFVSTWTDLRTLDLSWAWDVQREEDNSPTAFAAALAACPLIDELTLHHYWATSADMLAIATALPRLAKLQLSRMMDLESLEFLSAAPQITFLSLKSPIPLLESATMTDHASAEAALKSIASLKHLDYLQSERVLVLDERQGAALEVPSQLCPSLRVFNFVATRQNFVG